MADIWGVDLWGNYYDWVLTLRVTDKSAFQLIHGSNARDLKGWRQFLYTFFGQWKCARFLIGGKWERWWVTPCLAFIWHPVGYFSQETPGRLTPPERVALSLSGVDWRRIRHRPTPICKETAVETEHHDLGEICRRYLRRRQAVHAE
jgi:hypothetical protein